MTDTALMVLVSHPVEGAEALARALVEGRLVACAQVLPPMTSIYHWKGKVETDRECLLLLKTLKSIWPRVEEAIRARHPYTVPEILGFECAAVSGPYLGWMVEVLGSEA